MPYWESRMRYHAILQAPQGEGTIKQNPNMRMVSGTRPDVIAESQLGCTRTNK
jgi:hypothetical protein